MKKLLFLLAALPLYGQAGTLKDFFSEHPELDQNLPIHTAISKLARFEADGFARREGGDGKSLMKDNGDKFAVLGFRRVKNSCQYPEAAAVLGLTEEDCKLISKTEI